MSSEQKFVQFICNTKFSDYPPEIRGVIKKQESTKNSNLVNVVLLFWKIAISLLY
jgi:hypothetical protein